MDIILKYFPDLTEDQISLFKQLQPLYMDWNAKVNVISRKDVDQFYERHVLHSLSLAKVFDFNQAHAILDLGTGGGFPGIPLAILYPNCQFLLADSIRKKINVVQAIVEALKLENVRTAWSRAEEVDEHFDIVITRAVAKLDKLLGWTKAHAKHMLALKGGDLKVELSEVANIKKRYTIYPISDIFQEDFFETKVIVETIRA